MEICQSDMEQPGWVRSWCQDDQQLPVAAEGYRMTTQTVPPSFSVYCVSFPFVMHADACTRIILAARGFISPYIMRKVSSSVGGPLSFVFPRINVTRVNWPWCSAVIAPLSFLWFVHEIKTHDICTIHGITAGSGHERANTVSVAIRMLHYAHMWIYISASKLPLSLSLSLSLYINLSCLYCVFSMIRGRARCNFSSRLRNSCRAPIECPYSSKSTSKQTFIAQENIAAKRRNTGKWWTGSQDALEKKARVKFIREIIYRDGTLRDVLQLLRREEEKERKKGVSGLFLG